MSLNLNRIKDCSLSLSLSLSPSDRYKWLNSTPHQLQFLELQSALMLEFHQDLSAADKAAQRNPLVPQFCAYLNASSYIAAVLREWGEQMVRGGRGGSGGRGGRKRTDEQIDG